MTQFADITINDGQATPVAHTFSARRITPEGVARWQDISGGIAVGFPTIDVSLRDPVPNKVGIPSYKASIKITIPTLETVNASTYNGITPAPTKAYEHIFEGSFIMPARGTTAQRKDAVAYVRNLLAQVDVAALLTDLSMIY